MKTHTWQNSERVYCQEIDERGLIQSVASFEIATEYGHWPQLLIGAVETWLSDPESVVSVEDYVDNFRFARKSDAGEVAAYQVIARNGCCGSSDEEITVGDETIMVGCNYGH